MGRLARDRVDVHALCGRFAETSDHADAVFECVPQDPYATVKDAHDRLAEAEAAWEDRESARYAVYAPDGSLAGFTGLFLEWDRRTGRIGVLDEPFWGNGYAGDCADAPAALAFDRLDLDLVEIGHEAGNERSKRFIERFVERHGGQYDGVLWNWTPLVDRVADHHRYTVTRVAYRRARDD